MGRVLVELGFKHFVTELAKATFAKLFEYLKIDARLRFIKEITEDDLNWCSSYIAVRPSSLCSLALIQKIKNSGRFYAAFYDDDLLYLKNKFGDMSKHIAKCIELSDIILSYNPLLAKEYSEIAGHKRFLAFDMPLEENEFTDLHDIGKIIRFVYAAGVDHAKIFEDITKPALNKFLEVNHDKVHFTFIGVKPDISDIKYQECFSFVKFMPLAKYNEYMRENKFDVGLSPLPDEKFCNRKYFNKFVEYSKVGITGLYSNCMPYTLIVEDNVNGFLVNNTPEDWLNAMQMIVDLTERGGGIKIYAANAQKLLRKKFSIPELADLMLQNIPELDISGTYKHINWKLPHIRLNMLRFIEKVEKFMYVFRQKGIKNAVKQVIDFILRRIHKKKD